MSAAQKFETVTTNANDAQAPQKVVIPLAKSFDIEAPKDAKVEAFADTGNPYVPARDPHHVHSKDLVRDVLAFLRKPDSDALYVFGHTGTGKTSGLNQILSVLNWPVQSITAYANLRFEHLVGGFVFKAEAPGEQPQMTWMDGPLVKAMRNGHVLIINEVDLMDPGELSGMNDILEGRPLVLTQNGGEIVHPHPKFRAIVTGNTNGGGDEMGVYGGALMQNIAAMDRYRMLEVDYLDEATELRILARVAPNLPDVYAKGMVKLANEVRFVFKGGQAEAKPGEEAVPVELGLTFSTRTLRRWANLALAFRGAPNPLEYALEQALLRRGKPEEREAILRMAKDIFGDQWK